MAQSVKRPTPDLSSDLDLRVMSSKPTLKIKGRQAGRQASNLNWKRTFLIVNVIKTRINFFIKL